MKLSYHVFLGIFCFFYGILSSSPLWSQDSALILRVGAERTQEYFPLIEGKNIALVVNQTSMIGDTHLVDSLFSAGFCLKKIFAPEHGFRGNVGAGEAIASGQIPEFEIPVVSLYGKSKKPTAHDLLDIDLIVFDIQDVGVRFYTFISTLEFVMEAAAENSIPVIVLDRPNPNGNTISGPVLNRDFQSFVGRQEIPVLYGMTIGEYALFLQGESEHFQSFPLDLRVIACSNYDRRKFYALPVAPSPNLPNMLSVLLYPSLCLLEGTDFSEGRGTDFPFQMYGHPKFKDQGFSFLVKSLPHALNPKWINRKIYGRSLLYLNPIDLFENNGFNISYLLDAYSNTLSKETFFKSPDFFDKLAGSDCLRKQLVQNWRQTEIENSWVEDINTFKNKRVQYLIYPDF
jgi:uncharacterized protein YbbC (DUF1343 family)